VKSSLPQSSGQLVTPSGLHKSGMAPSRIAEKLGTSARTIQRWLKDESPVKVKVLAMKADESVPQSVAKTVATSEKFDIGLSRRMAIRLLNLSDAALTAVEDCLSDPDARRADKLRAAALVADWLGLSGARHPSGDFVAVPRRVEQVFGVRLADDIDAPRKLPQPQLPASGAGQEEE
jgi:transcriptional regulator with XRE-family HTH domain